MRPETLKELPAARANHADQGKRAGAKNVVSLPMSSFPRISINEKHLAARAQEILERKVKLGIAALQHSDSAGSFFSTISTEHSLKAHTRQEIGVLCQLLTEIMSQLFESKTVKRIREITHADVNASSAHLLIENLFAGNMRNFLANAVQTTLYVSRMARSKLGIQEHDLLSASGLSLLKRLLKQTTFFVDEGSFLSGGSVLPPQNYNGRSGREGDWCPALFFSKPISGERYWPSLVPIRVLQIVGNLYRNSRATRRYPAAWIPILQKLFGYSGEQINEALLRLLDYGLIEKGSLAWRDDGKANVVLRLTAKGDFILNLPFNDLATAYHMALFAPMSADIWGENHTDSRLFMMHEMKLEQHLRNRNWLRSALVTGTTLLRHVHHFAQREMNTVDPIHMGQAAQVFDVKRAELHRWFALPTFDGWYAQVGTRLSALQKGDRRPESVALRPERVKWLEELEKVIPMVVVPAS